MSSPASHGDGPGSPRRIVSKFNASTVRQTRSISGAMRLSAARVRQSNDCMLTRAVSPASRTAFAIAAAKVSGSGVSAPERWRDLGLDVEAHVLGAAAAHQIEQLGQCRNARAVPGTLFGKVRRVGAAGLEPADIVALHLAQA